MTLLSGVVFLTCKGWIGVSASEAGIASVTRPHATETEAQQQLIALRQRDVVIDLDNGNGLVERISHKIAAFFVGEPVAFDEPVDLSNVSEFDQQVLRMTRDIPYGEVRSYAWVATAIGRPKAARAVGQALHRNPVPIIIPCHRVIASNGELRGFGWGLEIKEWLLVLERSS